MHQNPKFNATTKTHQSPLQNQPQSIQNHSPTITLEKPIFIATKTSRRIPPAHPHNQKN